MLGFDSIAASPLAAISGAAAAAPLAKDGFAVLTGKGVVDAVGQKNTAAATTLSSVASSVTVGQKNAAAAATLTGKLVADVASAKSAASATTISARAQLFVIGSKQVPGFTTLSVSGFVEDVGSKAVDSTAQLSAVASVVVVGTSEIIINKFGFAVLTARADGVTVGGKGARADSVCSATGLIIDGVVKSGVGVASLSARGVVIARSKGYIGPAKIVFSSMFPTLAFMSVKPGVAIAGISPAIKIRSS